jgi:hypothetical protein
MVAQGEDLELEGGPRSEAGAERREEGEDDCLHGRSRLADLSATTSESSALSLAPRNSP